MRIKPLILAGAALMAASVSCTKSDLNPDEKKECGDELRTILSVSDAQTWQSFSNFVSTANAHYKTYYSTENGQARFKLFTQAENVCPSGLAEVGTQLITAIDVPEITLTASVTEEGFTNPVSLPITKQSNSVHNGNNAYAFRGDGNNAANLIYESVCSFPTHGSWSADSTFFFGALSSFYLSFNGSKFD